MNVGLVIFGICTSLFAATVIFVLLVYGVVKKLGVAHFMIQLSLFLLNVGLAAMNILRLVG